MSSALQTNDKRTWKAHPGYGGGAGKIIIVLVLVMVIGGVLVAVLASSGTIPSDETGELARYIPFLVAPLVLVAIFVPLLAMRRKGGRIHLGTDSLVFDTRKGRREFALGDLELSLARLYTGGNYMGSLCILRSNRNAETIRLLGAGVEFPPERYNAADSSLYQYDFSLDAQSFRELVEALGKGTLAPPPASGPMARAPGPSFRGEQVFEAVPGSGKKVLKIVVTFFVIMILLGLLGTALQESFQGEEGSGHNTALVIALSVVGVMVPAGVIVFFLRRGKGGKSYLRFSDQAIVLSVGKGERFRADMPPASVSNGHWQTSGQYGSYLQGPAVRIRNRQGKKLTLGVRDPSQAVKGTKAVGMIDYVLSADAGKAFLDFLEQKRLFH